ncbi:MAG: cytochrome C [Deltaproteobacteria bacterium]|nr:cytochrome C [Deltaproteobacteria bacterium]
MTVLLFGFIPFALAEESPSIRSDPEDFYPSFQSDDPRSILLNVPSFTYDKRSDEIDSYPCTTCHGDEDLPPNPRVRDLEEMHAGVMLVHGNGRFWCLTCHSLNKRDYLVSLKNQLISFDESFLLCGQCHYERQKDFFFGAHGKRKDNWILERKLAVCTECHNPHVTKIKSRRPVATPQVRKGLKPMKRIVHEKHKIW